MIEGIFALDYESGIHQHFEKITKYFQYESFSQILLGSVEIMYYLGLLC